MATILTPNPLTLEHFGSFEHVIVLASDSLKGKKLLLVVTLTEENIGRTMFVVIKDNSKLISQNLFLTNAIKSYNSI